MKPMSPGIAEERPPVPSVARLFVPLAGVLLLGAHMLRAGDMYSALSLALLSVLLFSGVDFVRKVISVVLFFGALYWVKVGVSFVQVRLGLGQDWLRLAGILGCVSLFSLWGAWTLTRESVGHRFLKGKENSTVQAITFFLTAVLLWICREKSTRITLLLADRLLPGSGVLEILCVALYAAFVAGFMLVPAQARKVRPRLWALFSAVFFGQLLLGLAGVDILLMTGDLHLPVPALIIAGPLYRGTGFFMLILFVVSVLLVGPAWCSHLCYIGAWDDMASRRQKGKPAPLPKWAKGVRAILAVAVFSIAMLLNWLGVEGVIAFTVAALFGAAGVGIMVLCSYRQKMMVHCSAFCPMGLVGNVLGKLSPWRLKISNTCTACGACIAVCRYNALSEKQLALGKPALSCSLCRDCTVVCRHGAISLAFPFISSASALRLFVVVTVSLHAVFLAVARM